MGSLGETLEQKLSDLIAQREFWEGQVKILRYKLEADRLELEAALEAVETIEARMVELMPTGYDAVNE